LVVLRAVVELLFSLDRTVSARLFGAVELAVLLVTKKALLVGFEWI
jgi:hypothetical protein